MGSGVGGGWGPGAAPAYQRGLGQTSLPETGPGDLGGLHKGLVFSGKCASGTVPAVGKQKTMRRAHKTSLSSVQNYVSVHVLLRTRGFMFWKPEVQISLPFARPTAPMGFPGRSLSRRASSDMSHLCHQVAAKTSKHQCLPLAFLEPNCSSILLWGGGGG